MRSCAVCAYLCLEPAAASGEVGIWTCLPPLVEAATREYAGGDGEERHVMVHVCPEHVVDIYRGRLPGVRMAWRMQPEPAASAPL